MARVFIGVGHGGSDPGAAANGLVEKTVNLTMALALRDGIIPPTVGYTVPDEDCDLDCVPNEGRAADIEYALSNSLGFGGHNACVLLKKWNG